MKKTIYLALSMADYIAGTTIPIKTNTDIKVGDEILDSESGVQVRITGRIINARPTGDIICFIYAVIV